MINPMAILCHDDLVTCMTILTIAFNHSGLRQILLALTALSALTLGACSKIDMPTTVTSNPIQLVEKDHSERYLVSELIDQDYDQMAAHYVRYGSSQAEIVVSYDPYSKSNTAMKATDALYRIQQALSERGVKDVKGRILAVDRSGDRSEMVISYNSVTAEGPEDCDMMPGYTESHAEINLDYKLGCSVNTMIARQVAHPEDLGGRRVEKTDGDGRRAGAVVEPYRNGTPNGQLQGAYTTQ